MHKWDVQDLKVGDYVCMNRGRDKGKPCIIVSIENHRGAEPGLITITPADGTRFSERKHRGCLEKEMTWRYLDRWVEPISDDMIYVLVHISRPGPNTSVEVTGYTDLEAVNEAFSRLKHGRHHNVYIQGIRIGGNPNENRSS